MVYVVSDQKLTEVKYVCQNKLKTIGNFFFFLEVNKLQHQSLYSEVFSRSFAAAGIFFPSRMHLFSFAHFVPVALHGEIQTGSSPPRNLRGGG